MKKNMMHYLLFSLVTFLTLCVDLHGDDDRRLQEAYQAYIQAFKRYTIMVTTPQKSGGNVEEALQTYRKRYYEYQELKKKKSITAQKPIKKNDLDISGIVKVKVSHHPKKILTSTLLKADKYRYGIGVKVDHTKAIKLYERAKREGDVQALLALSEYYEEGIWVRRDHQKAKKLLLQAVKEGSTEAKWQLTFLEHEE